jgi:hypothetical protein
MDLGFDFGPMVVKEGGIAGEEVVLGKGGEGNEADGLYLGRTWMNPAQCEPFTKSADPVFRETLIIEIEAIRTWFLRDIGYCIHVKQAKDFNFNPQFFKHFAS